MAFSIKKQANLNFKKNTTFKIPRTGSGAPILWKIAIFGAGTDSANSEYVWDGTTITNGYLEYFGNEYRITYDGGWKIYDSGNDQNLYASEDLITWTQVNGALQVPSSALSYSQSSYIQTIVLGGADPDQTGTYTWDGTTFIDGKPKYMGPLKTGAPENNYIYYTSDDAAYVVYGYKTTNEEMIVLSNSADLLKNWNLGEGNSEPTVSSIIYTA
jgi:hypothetical protein